MVVDNICHCADLKLKEGLNVQAEKHKEKNQDRVAGFCLPQITTAESGLCN